MTIALSSLYATPTLAMDKQSKDGSPTYVSFESLGIKINDTDTNSDKTSDNDCSLQELFERHTKPTDNICLLKEKLTNVEYEPDKLITNNGYMQFIIDEMKSVRDTLFALKGEKNIIDVQEHQGAQWLEEYYELECRVRELTWCQEYIKKHPNDSYKTALTKYKNLFKK